jgi:hypothetical protein
VGAACAADAVAANKQTPAAMTAATARLNRVMRSS